MIPGMFEHMDATDYGQYKGELHDYLNIPREHRIHIEDTLRKVLRSVEGKPTDEDLAEYRRLLAQFPPPGYDYSKLMAPVPPPDFDDIEDTKPSERIPMIVPRPPVEEEEGARFRYEERIEEFMADGKRFPRVRHHFFWLLHNIVAHPLLGLMPHQVTVDIHDLTSKWLNHQSKAFLGTSVPVIPSRKRWLFHNLIAHVAIGLVPCKATFAMHDRSAKDMNVDGWV